MKNGTGFRHLTANDRDRIHALYGQGHDQTSIAGVLGVHKGTVSRELRRYEKTTWRYSASRAQQDAEEKRRHSKRPGMKIEETPTLRQYLIKELKRLRSPDEIAGRMKKDGTMPRVGKTAIYKWLYSDDGRPYCRFLCTKRTRKKRQSHLTQKVHIPARKPLNERPDTEGLVHTEGDLFVSPRTSGSKRCGLLVVEKESKLLSGGIVANKSAHVIVPAMRRALSITRPDTCTLDNGIENIHHRDFGVPTYFCDPGSPTQKPDAEGSIGLVRRWFNPKGTNLDHLPDATYQSQLHLLNHKYRKSLGYRSSYEYALERGIITKVPKISLSKAVAFR